MEKYQTLLLLLAVILGGCSGASLQSEYSKILPDGTVVTAKDSKTYQRTVSWAGIGGPEAAVQSKPMVIDGDELSIGGHIAAMGKSSSSILIYVGIAFVVAGVLVFIFLKAITPTLICIAAGSAFIGVGLLVQTYPWALLVAAALVVGLIGYVIYRMWKSGRLEMAFKTVVGGIEKAPADAQAQVKTSIQTEAGKDLQKIKATVSAAKK